MTLRQEYELTRDSERIPTRFSISKEAEETIFFYARQINCSPDDALNLLIWYAGLTINMDKIMNDLEITFDSKKVF